jgi:DNA invertase Pin-like site-specific DNA recombinase
MLLLKTFINVFCGKQFTGKLKLVAYVRVSQEEENPENQKYAIYEWASKNGHTIIDVYEDLGVSGALAPMDRPGFQKALVALENADGLVVYALDRLARSLVELVDVVKLLESKGKVVLSVREYWLQQLDPKIRSLILAIMGWAAEMEREFIKERTREALKRLKAMGKRLGRPAKVDEALAQQALRYVEKGYTLRDAAKILGVGYGTLARYLTTNATLRARYYEARARAKRRKK